MSNLINNREYRRDVLKSLIGELHAGKGVDEVKQKFEDTFAGVSASEIAEVEQALIMDGMPVSEVQRLCDVHAAVFKGSIEQIHAPKADEAKAGHPADILKEENRAIEALLGSRVEPDAQRYAQTGDAAALQSLKDAVGQLQQIDIHYQKKENLLFPYLERYGITAPPKVMWGVDDEIRALLKSANASLDRPADGPAIAASIKELAARIREMIFKEDNILLPMALDTLTEDEWKSISRESGEFGACLIDVKADYAPEAKAPVPEPAPVQQGGALRLPSGVLTLEEVVRIFDTLPFDVTFVDKDDRVKYFSQGTDRIFARTNAVIGRSVMNCHPPASVHIVEKIVLDFKSGAKDHEDFWIRMGNRYVLIRYFAVRSEAGEYLGTLEVTQDIAPIQAIDGEKRLMSE